MRNTGFISAALAGAAMFSATAAEAQVQVSIDQARKLSLGSQAATVVVGNPMIADAVVHDGDTLFVFGKTYGVTNLIALNAYGETIYSTDISVTDGGAGDAGTSVQLHRGAAKYSYHCTGRCQAQPSIGDDSDWASTISGQQQAKISGGETSD